MAQKSGNDPQDLSFLFGDAGCGFAHQADASAAEDEPKAVLSDQRAEIARRLRIDGVVSAGRAAKDADPGQVGRNGGSPPVSGRLLRNPIA